VKRKKSKDLGRGKCVAQEEVGARRIEKRSLFPVQENHHRQGKSHPERAKESAIKKTDSLKHKKGRERFRKITGGAKTIER